MDTVPLEKLRENPEDGDARLDESGVPRSRAPRVCGILSITFGCLVLMLYCLMLVSLAPSFLTNLEKIRAAGGQLALPPAVIGTAVSGLGFCVLAPVLVVLGIAQCRRRRWARRATLAWAAAAILVAVVGVIPESSRRG